jgi:8-oxo-dGTP pyrophosphatase MutT (NUDIX family)
VGGKLDPFESPLKSAIRETFEETGIKFDTMKFCGILTETSPQNTIGQVMFIWQILILLNPPLAMKEV